MLLNYSFKDQNYKILIHWTADTGNSMVFKDIVRNVSIKHQLELSGYCELSNNLDDLVDKLYEQLYIFTDEYSSVPYNPPFRRVILQALAAICDGVKKCPPPDSSENENPLAVLFADVADKLHEIVNVFLEDNTYQEKHRFRRRKLEQSVETTDEGMFSCEFEDVLLQMTELSRVMDCLTDTQRGRFVKHFFLKYTFEEIADHEQVAKQSVQESIVAALKKIRMRLS